MAEETRLWVHESFKKRMKIIAAENDRSIIELTREMAKEDSLRNIVPNKKKRRNRFGFFEI